MRSVEKGSKRKAALFVRLSQSDYESEKRGIFGEAGKKKEPKGTEKNDINPAGGDAGLKTQIQTQ